MPERDDRADPLLGQVLDGRYRVEALVGAGGMGVVYRAVQLSVDRPVAVKVLHPDASSDPEVVRRFEEEARVVSRLRHPNTVTLIDFGRTASGRLYLVCELMRGAPLDDVLAQGPLSPQRTASLVRQVAQALAEAHTMGVVHRDLKPSNLFVEQVDTQEVVKLLDFGIAKLADGGVQTASGRIFGTPLYMSPEQAEGLAVDARSDLYSLGVVAFECLAGRPPFTGSTAYSILMKHVHDDVPSLPMGEPALDALVRQLLEKAPADRPADAREVARRALAVEHGSAASGPTLSPPRVVEPVEALGSTATWGPAGPAPVVAAPRRARWPIAVVLAGLGGLALWALAPGAPTAPAGSAATAAADAAPSRTPASPTPRRTLARSTQRP
ncbi:MAG: serine/threonine protein kinase [Myxococcales bacterium]|nr:serine/threonine protein kinase [Myxococcales bacterium]